MLLTRSIIEKYCVQKGFKNLSFFLADIAKEGVTDFVSFLEKVENLKFLMTVPQKILFHGSIHDFDILKISEGVSLDQHHLIYATDNPAYAIFLGIIDIQEGGSASVEISSDGINKFTLSKGFVEGKSQMKNGYVHVVSKNEFIATSNAEYVSSKSVPVLFSIPVIPKDFTEEIVIEN